MNVCRRLRARGGCSPSLPSDSRPRPHAPAAHIHIHTGTGVDRDPSQGAEARATLLRSSARAPDFSSFGRRVAARPCSRLPCALINVYTHIYIRTQLTTPRQLGGDIKTHPAPVRFMRNILSGIIKKHPTVLHNPTCLFDDCFRKLFTN
ncbi:hypothetical protein GWI33_020333 [Rhynchophorus ferrugineus]|uniref:Uncharacterized protein n=1 Tax=Rhynchophorus ferrugineus TaxID=354439 RepID=A0A834HWK7_RHYFE|nr:hypothetical protein GWI33_020333 [Rhynchophorus ferrugineus]